MSFKLILILCIIFTLNGAYALAFDEKIQLNGDGKLVCRTETQVARDQIDASGSQSYQRVLNLDTENKTASLKSIYTLNKPNGNKSITNSNNDHPANDINGKVLQEQYPALSNKKAYININASNVKAFNYEYLPIYSRSFRVKDNRSDKFDVVYNNSEDLSRNQYGIMMIDPNSIEHGAFVKGTDHFRANNTISFDGDKVTTNYSMSGFGLLKGSVIESDTMRRPHYLAETLIRDSNFTISSGLKSEAKFGKILDDRETQSKKVDQVEVGSKKEKYSDQKSEIKEDYTEESITKYESVNVIPWQVGPTFVLDYTEPKQSEGNVNPTEVDGTFVPPASDPKQPEDTMNPSPVDGTFVPPASDPKQPEDTMNPSPVDGTFVPPATDPKQPEDTMNPSPVDVASNPKAAESKQTEGKPSANIQQVDKKIHPVLALGRLTEGNVRGNTLRGTIIPGTVFGAAINSTHDSSKTMVGSSWGKAYIGDYQPSDNQKYITVSNGSSYNISLINGIFVVSENKTGYKQRYLNIGSSKGRIKIRATPPDTRFDIYEAVVA